MGKPCPTYQPKETRICNFREVSLGFNKKIAQAEARRCPQCAVATCLSGCPLGIDIPGFIRLLREGEAVLALERIKKENPFPAICGRICPAPCEQACVFHADGDPIAIRGLERFAADFGHSKSGKPHLLPQGKKVAIIGSGPVGMSAAYFLAKMNFSVTIFEAAHEPGGLLRYAIPEFRLPQKVLDEQFSKLKWAGVEIQTDVVFGRTMMIDELFMRGFSAVLLATGASLPVFSDLPGSGLSDVYYDMEFLYRLQTTGKENVLQAARQQGIPGPKTVIVGRGPSAFDAARLSLRLGSEVKVLLDGVEVLMPDTRRSLEQTGVDDDILKESREEGIEILSMKVLSMLGDDSGFVRGVKCQKLDEEPIILEAQTVIIANGRRPNAQTGMTNMEKVFACGSVVTAGGSVVESIAGGKAIVQKISQYLITMSS